jgi:hypothetical protein
MKIVLIVLLVLVVIVVVAAAYMGAFARIDIAEKESGPFTLVYRDMAAGEMNKVGAITTELNALLEASGVTQRKPLDVFFPDGRGEIGFAVEGVPPEILTALAGKARVRQIPAQQCMIVEFPWRNPMSFMVGYFKVDPALADYRGAHHYRKVEALALNNGAVITYMQPVVRE